MTPNVVVNVSDGVAAEIASKYLVCEWVGEISGIVIGVGLLVFLFMLVRLLIERMPKDL